MKKSEVIERINEKFLGQVGEVETFTNKKAIGKFLSARFKNEGIIIFEFEDKHVGLALCIMVFSTIKAELAEGFEGDEICKEISIGGKNFGEIIKEIA